MTELNDKKVKVISCSNGIKIDCDTTNFHNYESAGIVTEVKVPFAYKFKSLKSSFLEPYCYEDTPYGKFKIEILVPDGYKQYLK